MVTATCGNCGKSTRLADVLAGRAIKCAQCGATVQVPGTGAATPVPVRPIPRNTTGRVPGGGLGSRLNRGTLALVIVGCVVAFFGGKELLLSQGASATPHDVKCLDLIEHGSGGNAHVRLTDFQMLPAYAYTFEKTTPDTWKSVFVPVVPLSTYRKHIRFDGRPDLEALKSSGDIHLIVELANAHNKADVERAMTANVIDGMVMNRVEGMSGPGSNTLRKEYPAMNLDAALLLHEGRTPNPGLGALGLFGGLAVIGLGLWLMFKPE